MSGPHQLAWLNRLELEHDNLRAALGWALDRGQAKLQLRLAAALRLFWFARGYLQEGRSWLERGLAHSRTVAVPVRAKALRAAGYLALFHGAYEPAREFLEESLVLSRALHDAEGIAATLTYLGFVALLGQQADLPVPALLDEALGMRSAVHDRRTVAELLIFAGMVALAQGDRAQAVALHYESLALCREIRDRWGITKCLTNLGLMAVSSGDMVQATALLCENLQLAWELEDKFAVQSSLVGLAGVAAAQGQLGRAVRLWGAAAAVREAAGIDLSPLARAVIRYDDDLAAARAKLGEAAFAATWAEGTAMTVRQAITYALADDAQSRTVGAQ